MNKKGLCKQIAEESGVPQEMVLTVMNLLEKNIMEALARGDQVHWGSFLRAWTLLKRPSAPSGKVLHEDTPTEKIRYLLPRCAFGSGVVRPLKQAPFNMAGKSDKDKEISFASLPSVYQEAMELNASRG